MADYTFFTNPMSRARIARWALHEVAADYEDVHVDWTDKPQALLEVNSMGKVPTIIHHQFGHDHVVSEVAAICHYLAEAEHSELLPLEEEKANYFRWLFFAAGPLEQAATARMFGWTVPQEREMAAGFGTYDRAMDALDTWLQDHDFVCGQRFTMADVYVGSQVAWGLEFNSFPHRESFAAYARRVTGRPAHAEAVAIDDELISHM